MASLLLIPDISGFTSFVNETEVKHSKHIIAELLELIIESDELGLTVSEIEGDAVFFYKLDDVPSIEKLLKQVKLTYDAFHVHLKNYETRRICPCGACCTAHSLKIKFIALRAHLEFIQVKDFYKPYGPDVILVHRLLKNNVANDEYVLVNDAYWASRQKGEPVRDVPGGFIEGVMSYPDLGEVTYWYAPIDAWYGALPEPTPVPVFERIKKPIRVEGDVAMPLFEMYELISNLDVRLQWNRGIDKLEYERDRINRVGTRHQCVVQGQLIDFETIVADFGENTLVYGEQVDNNPLVNRFAIFWIITENGPQTHLVIEMHYHLKAFPLNLIGFFFRWNAARQIKGMFSRIKEIAEKGSRAENSSQR